MTSPRGARSDAALAVLAEALCSEGNESARRAGCYGLGAAGDRAVPTLIRVLETTGVPALVAGLAVESLGEAAMTPDARVVAAMDAACWVQHDAIGAAEASPESEATPRTVHAAEIATNLPYLMPAVSALLCLGPAKGGSGGLAVCGDVSATAPALSTVTVARRRMAQLAPPRPGQEVPEPRTVVVGIRIDCSGSDSPCTEQEPS